MTTGEMSNLTSDQWDYPKVVGMAWRWGFWFRVFGRGLGVVNHNQHPPLFSERYNGRYGVRKRFYLHIGPWCLRPLGFPSKRDF